MQTGTISIKGEDKGIIVINPAKMAAIKPNYKLQISNKIHVKMM